MTNPGAAGCFAATRAIKRSCSGSKVAQVRNGAKKKRLEVKIGNWGQSKRVLRKPLMLGRVPWWMASNKESIVRPDPRMPRAGVAGQHSLVVRV